MNRQFWASIAFGAVALSAAPLPVFAQTGISRTTPPVSCGSSADNKAYFACQANQVAFACAANTTEQSWKICQANEVNGICASFRSPLQKADCVLGVTQDDTGDPKNSISKK